MRCCICAFAVSLIVVAISLIVYAVAGMAIGALNGWLTSSITKAEAGLVVGCIPRVDWFFGWFHRLHVHALAEKIRLFTSKFGNKIDVLENIGQQNSALIAA
jgi:hypothetical protein